MVDETTENPTLDTPTFGVEKLVSDESGNPPSEVEDTSETTEGASETEKDDTDWKKRHADAVRWAQREAESRQKLEKRLEELDARSRILQAAGLDFDSLESYLETDNQKASIPSDYVPKKEFENAVQTVNQKLWNAAKMIFVAGNPEFKDPDLSTMLDYECSRIAQEEMNTTGNMMLSSEELLAKGAKRLKKFINKIKGEGEKSATEKRKKISEAGVTAGRDQAKKIEEEEMPSPADLWLGGQRKTQERIKARA